MKYVELSRNKKAIVDDELFDKVNSYKWYCSSRGYAQRTIHVNGKRKEILLHRFLLNARKGQEIDHINRDPLDNRLQNLRFCTRSENNLNKGLNKNNKSGYKGISWHKGGKKWLAQICIRGNRINIGLFDNINEAYKVRQKYVEII